MVRGVDWLASKLPPDETFTKTELTPLQVSGAIGYEIEINLLSPPLKEIIDEAMTVSSPQLETALTVTV